MREPNLSGLKRFQDLPAWIVTAGTAAIVAAGGGSWWACALSAATAGLAVWFVWP